MIKASTKLINVFRFKLQASSFKLIRHYIKACSLQLETIEKEDRKLRLN
jgi:hypothetical protein